VLVRHGESVWNAEGRVQGQACAGLSAVGHAQARVTAAALASAYPDARLVTSDLQRTRETAAPMEAELRTSAPSDARLRERSFGRWEGLRRVEVEELDPKRSARWATGEDVVDEVGGETGEQLADRVDPVLRELLRATPVDGVTVAVTHGGSIWFGVHRTLGLPLPSLGGVANCSLTELVAFDRAGANGAGGEPVVVLDRWNEVAHLPVELRTGWRARTGRDETAEPSNDETEASTAV
jgi:glucosyl-3-phosphoglycerate phosphatase